MSINSGLKATKIIGQRKAFYRQRIPEFSCARKETVDIDILVTSRNGDIHSYGVFCFNIMCVSDKLVIARLPRTIRQIFSSFLTFYCFFTRFTARKVSLQNNTKNLKNIAHIVLGPVEHVALQELENSVIMTHNFVW